MLLVFGHGAHRRAPAAHLPCPAPAHLVTKAPHAARLHEAVNAFAASCALRAACERKAVSAPKVCPPPSLWERRQQSRGRAPGCWQRTLSAECPSVVLSVAHAPESTRSRKERGGGRAAAERVKAAEEQRRAQLAQGSTLRGVVVRRSSVLSPSIFTRAPASRGLGASTMSRLTALLLVSALVQTASAWPSECSQVVSSLLVELAQRSPGLASALELSGCSTRGYGAWRSSLATALPLSRRDARRLAAAGRGAPQQVRDDDGPCPGRRALLEAEGQQKATRQPRVRQRVRQTDPAHRWRSSAGSRARALLPRSRSPPPRRSPRHASNPTTLVGSPSGGSVVKQGQLCTLSCVMTATCGPCPCCCCRRMQTATPAAAARGGAPRGLHGRQRQDLPLLAVPEPGQLQSLPAGRPAALGAGRHHAHQPHRGVAPQAQHHHVRRAQRRLPQLLQGHLRQPLPHQHQDGCARGA